MNIFATGNKIPLKSFWKIFNLVILLFLIIISLLGTFYKHISFGKGLGDMVGYCIL
jgi:energy-coupling factor transporter transmembrane protein EcfT